MLYRFARSEPSQQPRRGGSIRTSVEVAWIKAQLRLCVVATSFFVAGAFPTADSHATLLAPPPPPLEFQNQQSTTTFYHSGINTVGGGIVWDRDFAGIVTRAVGVSNYNEIAFAFLECFGGGMIDELGNLNLVPASYTSAARHDEFAWAGARDPASGGLRESYYNIHYAPAAGGAAVNTLIQAATTGRNLDLVGPVVNMPSPGNPIEHPQYTSSGPIGDNITLHRNNPLNPTPNNNYRAILFGGSDINGVSGPNNFNSLNHMRNELLARGYNANEIYVLYPLTGGQARDPAGNVIPWVNADATAANLRAAWATFVGDNTNPNTQIFYWNSIDHGTRMFDLVGWIKDKFNSLIQKATTYTFDLLSNFIDQIKQVFQFMVNGNAISPLDLPHFEVVTDRMVADLTATMNGSALTPLSVIDLYGDGSEFAYNFNLSLSDIFSLGTAGNTFQMNWLGDDPTFLYADLNLGDRPNALSSEVPEPPSILLLVLALLMLLAFKIAHGNGPSFVARASFRFNIGRG